ncbi:hypothetical protein [Spongiimicrobium salis]|uniref:hypothetical protein n=1 Tax=Spongiimicrobium salis TaxID=1667022 RepID=UPI00374D3F9A
MLCWLSTSDGRAQIENLPISSELTMDKLYAGVVAYTTLSEQHRGRYHRNSIQIGARLTSWLVPKTWKIRTSVVLKGEEKQMLKSIRSYEIIFTPGENVKIALGAMATPTTELRPSPLIGQSQVETNAESNILGGRAGVKVDYIFHKLKLSYGIHKHENKLGQHLKMTYNDFALASFIEDGNLFIAAKWEKENTSLLFTRDGHETAFSAVIPVSKVYRFYIDMEYHNAMRDITFGECGLRRYFSDTGVIKGFWSLHYNKTQQRLHGGIFIHI